MGVQSNKKAQPYYFISYCREEVTFVDDLARELEKRGINIWVDIHDLVPGSSWQEQLDRGVENSAGILLVVSKASMKSDPVKDEWTKAINVWKKPVTLILFEPVKLPEAIRNQNPFWVDFTGNFNKALDRLVARLNNPASSEQPPKNLPPQRGFWLPFLVLVFIILSVVSFFYSWIGVWSVFIATPISMDTASSIFALLSIFLSFTILLAITWQFIQIPWRVFRRTHNAENIRNVFVAAIVMNILILISYFLYDAAKIPGTLQYVASNLPINIGLLYLLNSKEMYRWAGATGIITKSPTPDIAGHTYNGKPKLVGIEYAPQDRLYAEALKDSITRAGHLVTDDLQKAETILCLLSTYQTDSAFNPQEKELFPVLIQRCKVAKKLSHLQWIDLRHGKASMDAITNLLDEPYELLRILGVLPVRSNILPIPVRVALNALAIPFAWTITQYVTDLLPGKGSILTNIQKYWPIFILLGIYLLRTFITERKLRFLPFLSYKWAVAFSVILACAGTFYIFGQSTGFPFITLSLLYWLIPAAVLRKEVRFWLPVAEK